MDEIWNIRGVKLDVCLGFQLIKFNVAYSSLVCCKVCFNYKLSGVGVENKKLVFNSSLSANKFLYLVKTKINSKIIAPTNKCYFY